MTKENKFTWNDIVKIKKTVPSDLSKKEIGVICGMGKIQNQELADKYYSQIGNWMYTVEFGDGSDLIIAEEHLEKYDEKS